MNKATDKVIFFYKHDGAVEACWTHNPEVGRSRLPRAKINQFIKKKQLCLKNLLIIGNSELRLGKILQTTRDEMLVLDNPLSPESGSSSRPIVIDSSSEQESLNPVTTVYQQPTEQPVLERSMALQNLIEDDIELDILEMNSF